MMSLRVHAATAPAMAQVEGNQVAGQEGDGWATRLAKLIPAEALGLYGAASAVVPPASAQFPDSSRVITLYVVAAVCLVFSAAIRWRATSVGGKPQYWAVAIAVISFGIWLLALGPPNSPIDIPQGYRFVGPLLAIGWAAIVSYFYKGDAPAPANPQAAPAPPPAGPVNAQPQAGGGH